MKNLTKDVAKILKARKKKKYAIHMNSLASCLNTSERQIRYAIEEIRRENLIDGYILVSDLEAGYWLSKDETEIENWLHHYLGKAFSVIKTAKAAKKFLKKSQLDKLQTKMKF